MTKVEIKQQKIVNKERKRIYRELSRQDLINRRNAKIAPQNAFISLININKIYDNYVQAVFDFNLNVKEREFLVLVGPSGCGKSTILRIIAGLESITYGDLFINGSYVNDVSAQSRNIAMVFQSYALYPHLNVYENIAFGLRMRHQSKEQINEAVHRVARSLDLEEYLDRKPAKLSGGQRQRVALGRAIVRESKLFLMDEPLSNLDAKLRVQMRNEIVKIHREIKATTIYVTHDQTEAMTMATRIVVMNKGLIQQIGTPSEIYNMPSNKFVAGFIGSPAMNIFKIPYTKGILHYSDDYNFKLTSKDKKTYETFYQNELKNIQKRAMQLETEINASREYAQNITNHRLENKSRVARQKAINKEVFKSFVNELDKGDPDLKKKMKQKKLELQYNVEIIKNDFLTQNEKATEAHLNYLHLNLNKIIDIEKSLSKMIINSGEEVWFGIRPEDIEVLTSKDEQSKNIIQTTINSVELLGREYFLYFNVGNNEYIAKVPATKEYNNGETIYVRFNEERFHLFDIITEKRIK